MKSFLEFVKEELPVNAASTGAVAALTGEPPKKKKKVSIFKRTVPGISLS